MKRPEILSPAGNFEKLKFAILYGADAVYLAGKVYGMRGASDNFSNDELCEAVQYAHKRNVKVYITVNVLPHESELSSLKDYLCYLQSSVKPDALIISDLGVFSLAAKYCPDIELHVSTQASTVNSQSCLTWQSLGAKRIVLARELSLEEIKKIRDNIPKELELEAFVHGAMCVSYSGRCLLSNFFTGRDANHGMCAQPCRWEYFEGEKYAEVFEKKRPDEKLSLVENERGTFMFSSKDLCMIEHIPELCEAGIDSLKIEGRVKSAYYTALTANIYKKELDKYISSPSDYVFDEKSLIELESVSHREYGTGYFFDIPNQSAKISSDGGYIREKAFLATVESYDDACKRAVFVQRNKLLNNTEYELVSPGTDTRCIFVSDMKDESGENIESAPHPQMRFSAKVPFPVKPGDIIRGK